MNRQESTMAWYIEPLIAITVLLLIWLVISLVVRFIYATEGYLEQFTRDDTYELKHLLIVPLWIAFKITTIVLSVVWAILVGWAVLKNAEQVRDWWHK